MPEDVDRFRNLPDLVDEDEVVKVVPVVRLVTGRQKECEFQPGLRSNLALDLPGMKR